jgi:hypothetical protein
MLWAAALHLCAWEKAQREIHTAHFFAYHGTECTTRADAVFGRQTRGVGLCACRRADGLEVFVDACHGWGRRRLYVCWMGHGLCPRKRRVSSIFSGGGRGLKSNPNIPILPHALAVHGQSPKGTQETGPCARQCMPGVRSLTLSGPSSPREVTLHPAYADATRLMTSEAFKFELELPFRSRWTNENNLRTFACTIVAQKSSLTFNLYPL